MERANVLVLAEIKPRLVKPLERSPGCWIDEIPAILWSLRTTQNRSTGFTPFFLIYDSEAVLAVYIEFDSPCKLLYTEKENHEAMEDSVDLIEEACELALTSKGCTSITPTASGP